MLMLHDFARPKNGLSHAELVQRQSRRFDAARRWIAVLRGAPAPEEAFGEPVNDAGEIKRGCC
ncbi:MAG: hypothetical protein ACLQPN_22690 [Bryobacteraceae bacterium]